MLGVAVFQAKKERDAGLATRSWRQLSGKPAFVQVTNFQPADRSQARLIWEHVSSLARGDGIGIEPQHRGSAVIRKIRIGTGAPLSLPPTIVAVGAEAVHVANAFPTRLLYWRRGRGERLRECGLVH